MADMDAKIVQMATEHRDRRIPCRVWWANVTIDMDDGPEVTWGGCDPEALILMAKALRDYARALRAGDDPGEIVTQEWRRRRAARAAEVDRRAGRDLAYGLTETSAAREFMPAGIPPTSASGA